MYDLRGIKIFRYVYYWLRYSKYLIIGGYSKIEIEKPEYKPKITKCRHLGMRIAMGKCRLRKGRR